MSLELYAAYVLACIVIILVPGPTVTLIIANSIRHGPAPVSPMSPARRPALPS